MMTATMGIAMRAVFSVLLVLALAACTAPGLPPDFASELARGEAGVAVIEVRNGEIGVVSVPMATVDLPERVAIAVDAIQPGGTAVEVLRVWRDGVESYAIAKSYGDGEAARRRSVWLTKGGEVIERTHQIALGDVAEDARVAVAELALGEAETAEVVQAEPGVERYRLRLRRADGARFIVECDLRGADVRVARWLSAEVRAWR